MLDTINGEWRKKRAHNKKSLSERTIGERENAVTAFAAFTGLRDIAEIERKHLISFRNHLADETDYSNATVNKKGSLIATLLTFASQQGLIERQAVGPPQIPVKGFALLCCAWSQQESAHA